MSCLYNHFGFSGLQETVCTYVFMYVCMYVFSIECGYHVILMWLRGVSTNQYLW